MPIVEPEVLMDGAHTIERCCRRHRGACWTPSIPSCSTSGSTSRGHAAQAQHGAVWLQAPTAQARGRGRRADGALLSAARAGGGAGDRVPVRRAVRPGATAISNAMNARGPQPWQLSFSYGRALQAPALKAWSGEAENVGRRPSSAFFHRARLTAPPVQDDTSRTWNTNLRPSDKRARSMWKTVRGNGCSGTTGWFARIWGGSAGRW